MHPLPAGTCYQEPGLTAEDLAEAQGGDGSARQQQQQQGELARFADDFGAAAAAAAAAAASGAAAAGKKAAGGGSKRKRGAPSVGEAETEAQKPAAPGKKQLLSTGVHLLDVRTAAREAPRAPRRQPGGAGGGGAADGVGAVSAEAPPPLSAALQALPDLLQRFMAGEGYAEPMPIQTRCGGMEGWETAFSEVAV